MAVFTKNVIFFSFVSEFFTNSNVSIHHCLYRSSALSLLIVTFSHFDFVYMFFFVYFFFFFCTAFEGRSTFLKTKGSSLTVYKSSPQSSWQIIALLSLTRCLQLKYCLKQARVGLLNNLAFICTLKLFDSVRWQATFKEENFYRRYCCLIRYY